MKSWDEMMLVRSVQAIARAVERIAAVVETPAEPVVAELGTFAQAPVLSWEDAARVLKDTCIEAPECGDGCIMYDWCKANLPGTLAPCRWTDPGAGT